MYYERMPLYPGMKPAGHPDGCMKVRLFDDGCCGRHRPPDMLECERVTIENPCRCGERAEVVLGVDGCGNLVICIHRDVCDPCRHHDPCHRDPCRLPEAPRPCGPKPCRDRCRVPCRRPPRGCGPSWR